MSKLIVPKEMLLQHAIWLGKTGSGKSSALRHVVEWLSAQGKRICIIDPKGDWWGVKFSADGKAAGLPFITFGNFKESKATDVPINERSGAHIAELIAGGNRPCVIGWQGWGQGKMTQFWIEFAPTLFAKNMGELYLVVDECHNVAPKGKVLSPQAGEALHWSNRMLSEGRGLGIVCLLASQRPQKVHNDTLTSCETLCAMRVVHKADRDAVRDWIDGCGDSDRGNEVLKSLAIMPRGEAWVWSPEIGFGPEQIKFPLFETFDSFAPPQLQKKVLSSNWETVDLEKVREKLSKVIEEAKANDPKELKQKIGELEQKLRVAQRNADKAQQTAPAAEPVEILTDKDRESIKKLTTEFHALYLEAEAGYNRIEEIGKATNELKPEFQRLTQLLANKLAPAQAIQARKLTSRPLLAVGRYTHRAPETPAPAPAANGEAKLTEGQQRVLNALAWYESIGNEEPTTAQVGALALIDPEGGHFGNVVGPLSSGGLIKRGNKTMMLTEEGRAYARVPERVATLEEYHEMLRERVRRAKRASGKTVEMLDVIIEAGGAELTAEEVGERVGVDPNGGHFGNVIGPLGTIGLIERQKGKIAPTEILFPKGIR